MSETIYRHTKAGEGGLDSEHPENGNGNGHRESDVLELAALAIFGAGPEATQEHTRRLLYTGNRSSRRIFVGLREGMSNDQIAEELGIEPSQVQGMVVALVERLGVQIDLQPQIDLIQPEPKPKTRRPRRKKEPIPEDDLESLEVQAAIDMHSNGTLPDLSKVPIGYWSSEYWFENPARDEMGAPLPRFGEEMLGSDF